MSLSTVHTCATLGMNAPAIIVEVHISNGLPDLTMVRLPKTTVKEARDRIRSAIINNGYEFPAKKITINLAPTDLPKEGGRYDLPIAVALLAVSEQLTTHDLDTYELIGELALTGALRGAPGAISNAIEAIRVGRRIIVVKENVVEVGLIRGEGYLIADRLQTVCTFLEGKHDLDRPSPVDFTPCTLADDLSDVIDQEQGRRGLEFTAADDHSFLLIKPSGTGKTMLASCLRGLLPPLSDDEALESAAILSLVNSDTLQKQWKQRPFRSPHHSASLTATVNGDFTPALGRMSLAHNGILLLDELPGFEQRTLDALRESIESGQIRLSRTRVKMAYPVRFRLIAAMDLSPTGHYQEGHNRCTPEQTLHYFSRLSGPFFDRLDLSLEIPLPPPGILSQGQVKGEDSVAVKRRVTAARERQYRWQNKSSAQLDGQGIHKYCPLCSDGTQWLEETLAHLGLSVRAWLRLMKVARTIANIE